MNGTFSNLLVTCPYDSSHQIAKHKFEKHLEKCRKNYRSNVKASNKKVVTELPCKYNPTEIINAPEILFHEARCSHRKIPSYLYLGLKHHKVTTDGVVEYPYANMDFPDPKEDTSLYDYTFVGKIIGSTTYGIPIDAGSVRYPKLVKLFSDADGAAKEVAEQKKMEEALASVEIFGGSEADGQQTVCGPSPQTQAFATAGGSGTGGAVADIDDEEDWGKTANAPSYNFMKAKMTTDKPLLRYPPGLTKAERRRFVASNSEWVERVQKQKKEEEKSKQLKIALQKGDDGEHDLNYPIFF